MLIAGDRPAPGEGLRDHLANAGQLAIVMREDAEALAQIGARILRAVDALGGRARAALLALDAERDAVPPQED